MNRAASPAAPVTPPAYFPSADSLLACETEKIINLSKY